MRGLKQSRQSLFYFGFFELNVFARNRVILFQHQFFRHGPGIFLGDVVKAGISSADQLDLDGCSFCHVLSPVLQIKGSQRQFDGRKYPERVITQLSGTVKHSRKSD